MQEFQHSVKVPRHYKLAANILKKALTEGASVKSLVFEDKLKHFRTNVLYALISEAIRHNSEIDKLFESTAILKNESRLDPWLAKILTVELLFGKKSLPGQSKPELTVASYREQFEKYSTENPEQIKKKGARRPRYVRINTNLLTTSDAIRAFQDEGYRLVRCTAGPYAAYLQQLAGLGELDFMQDYHVKTVFVFAPGTRLHEHPLYVENKIILQDKATAMAVHLLAPPAGSVVMDLCAAPGMKTTQLAAYMRNQGTVYAVERSEERYKTLCDFVEKTGSTCVKTINKDALDIKRGDYPDVEYVLLDPSCSGSGMDLCGHDYIEDARLARLTSLQEKFLKHAMHAFPRIKRIVYSTCSLFPQENERVVTNVVMQCRTKWNVLDVKELLKEQWNNFGSGMFGSIGLRCMYARPDTDLTTGFFLAVMDKDTKYLVDPEKQDSEKSVLQSDVKNLGKKCIPGESQGDNSMDADANGQEDNEDGESYKNNKKNKKKKLKKDKDVSEENDTIQYSKQSYEETKEPTEPNEENCNNSGEEKKEAKEKNKKRKQELYESMEEDHVTSKKKKSKDKTKKLKCKEPDQELCNDVIQISDEDISQQISKKKKNKQKKNAEIQFIDQLPSENIIAEDDKIVSKKKNKKKKSQESDIVTDFNS